MRRNAKSHKKRGSVCASVLSVRLFSVTNNSLFTVAGWLLLYCYPKQLKLQTILHNLFASDFFGLYIN